MNVNAPSNLIPRLSAIAPILVILLSQDAPKTFAGTPPEPEIRLVATGLAQPVGITHAGDGSDRLFILEKRGVIRILDSGRALAEEPFLDIESLISSGGERGLLGIAFHPDYAVNRRFFVHYTDSNGDSIVAEFTIVAGQEDVGDPTSQKIILGPIDQPNSNHNGGWIGFSPLDGLLYIALGDGGGANDGHGEFGNAQNPATLLGKILRIDVDDIPEGADYGIPPDNPFANDGDDATRAEIYKPWACAIRGAARSIG